MRKWTALVWAVCGLSACPLADKLKVNAPPPLNLNALGSKVLTDVGNAKLELDPTVRDALTALGECADLISYCYAPPQTDLATCVNQAAMCPSDTPWVEGIPCCPQACKDAFTAEVQAGATQRDALEKVLFLKPDCFPGVNAAVGNP